MVSKICPSCSVENNPSFSQCWKCGLVFDTGKKAPLPNRNAEMADRWWSAMTSITVAEQATKSAFGAAMVSAALTAILAILPLFGKAYLGFNLGNLSDVFLILALGYGVKKRSRVCAVLLLVYFVAGKLLLIAETSGNGGTNIVSGVIWGLFYVNGVRGAFAYHKFSQNVIDSKSVIVKTLMALIYGVFTIFLSLVLFQNKSVPDANSLVIIPAILMVWASYIGWLPFTKESEVSRLAAKWSASFTALILAITGAVLVAISFFFLNLISFDENATSGMLLIGAGLFFLGSLVFLIIGIFRKDGKRPAIFTLIIFALTLIVSLNVVGHIRNGLIKETPQEQEAQWKQMTAEARAYYESNEYEKGVEVSKKALQFAETTFGNAHPYVATSVNNLAEFYRGQKKYTEAEALCKRSISILEMAFEHDHYTMSMPLNTLGLIYVDQGKYDAAELSFKRAIELARKSPKPDEGSINRMMANLESIKSLKK